MSKVSSESSVRRRESIDREQVVLDTLKTIAPALAQVFGPHCEVVVHDLRQLGASIVAIENGHITGRVVGGPLVGGPIDDEAIKWLSTFSQESQMKVYETRTRSGTRLKSASVVFRDRNHKPHAALCMNVDTSDFRMAARLLEELAAIPGDDDTRPQNNATSDVDTILDNLIEECVHSKGVQPKTLSRETRRRTVQELDDRGAFLIRGAVRRVASVLGVSKFTIYGDLDHLRTG